MRILLVEDDAMIAEALTVTLRNLAHQSGLCFEFQMPLS